ncbi:MAG: hypothetical protein WBV79_20510, partial [Rhodomicrobium sp.]
EHTDTKNNRLRRASMPPSLDFPPPHGLKQNHVLHDIVNPFPADAFLLVWALISDMVAPELSQNLF